MSGKPSGTSEYERLPPMSRYVLGLLRRPDGLPALGQEEAALLQEGHLAHLRRLRESGLLITVGPLEEDTPLRGVLVFRTSSVNEARELMRTDPIVGAGRLVLELFTWYAPSGLQVAAPETPAPDSGLTFETD